MTVWPSVNARCPSTASTSGRRSRQERSRSALARRIHRAQLVAGCADVKAGEPIFMIDPRPLHATLRQAEANVARDTARSSRRKRPSPREADVQQAQANLERDIAQVENARIQEGRYRTLLQQELVAREQYDQIRTNGDARGHGAGDRAAFTTPAPPSRRPGRPSRTRVRSSEPARRPSKMRGSSSAIPRSSRPWIGPHGPAEVRVAASSERAKPHCWPRVHRRSDVRDLQRQRARCIAGVAAPSTPGSLRLRGITTPSRRAVYPHSGRLDFVDRAVDPLTGTLALRATFPNRTRMLQPGSTHGLMCCWPSRQDSGRHTAGAVQEAQGSATVFVVGADRRAGPHRQNGTAGRDALAVEKGLRPGEKVVVKGLQRIRPGMRRGGHRRSPGASPRTRDLTVFVKLLHRPQSCRRARHRDRSGRRRGPFRSCRLPCSPHNTAAGRGRPPTRARAPRSWSRRSRTPSEHQGNGVENMITCRP